MSLLVFFKYDGMGFALYAKGAKDLISQVQLSRDDVEVVFINGKVASLDTIIQDNDRVALVPHGTPGPYRVLLGFKNKNL